MNWRLVTALCLALFVTTAIPVSAATVTIDNFEDGDMDEYTIRNSQNVTLQQNAPIEGAWSLNVSAPTGTDTPANYATAVSLPSDSPSLEQYPRQGDSWTIIAKAPDQVDNQWLMYFGAQNDTAPVKGYRVKFITDVDLRVVLEKVNDTDTYTLDSKTVIHDSDYQRINFTYRWSKNGDINVSIDTPDASSTGWVNATDTQFSSGGTGYGAKSQVAASVESRAIFDSKSAFLNIKNESAPDQFVTNTLNVTFFGDGGDIVQRQTSGGTVSLTPLNISQDYVARIEDLDNDYATRTLAFTTVTENQTAYLLNSSRFATHDIRFSIEDKTGDFEPSETTLIIQRSLSLNGQQQWTTISSGGMGATNQYDAVLKQDQRYRLRVESGVNERTLGQYEPTKDETVVLTIGEVVIDPGDTDGPVVNASRTNLTNQEPQVTFELNDTSGNTSKVWLHIYEYQNESNELLANTSFTGPYGTFSNTETVTDDDENNTVWVVEYTLERDSGNIHGTIIVGPQRPLLPDLSPWVVTFIFVGVIFMTAGLFSELNASIGAVVVAAVGALFFYVNLVPPQLGAGVMLLSLMAAAMIWINEHRGGNL